MPLLPSPLWIERERERTLNHSYYFWPLLLQHERVGQLRLQLREKELVLLLLLLRHRTMAVDSGHMATATSTTTATSSSAATTAPTASRERTTTTSTTRETWPSASTAVHCGHIRTTNCSSTHLTTCPSLFSVWSLSWCSTVHCPNQQLGTDDREPHYTVSTSASAPTTATRDGRLHLHCYLCAYVFEREHVQLQLCNMEAWTTATTAASASTSATSGSPCTFCCLFDYGCICTLCQSLLLQLWESEHVRVPPVRSSPTPTSTRAPCCFKAASVSLHL
jgi:hypothetical protein